MSTKMEIKMDSTQEVPDDQTMLRWNNLRVGKIVSRLNGNDMTLFMHATIPECTPLCRFCKEEDKMFNQLIYNCQVFWKQNCKDCH